MVALGRKDDASWNLMIALALVVLIHFEPWKLALPLIRSSFSFVCFEANEIVSLSSLTEQSRAWQAGEMGGEVEAGVALGVSEEVT